MKIIRKSSNYLSIPSLFFVIGVHVQYADGCRSKISRLGFDLSKFDLKQTLNRGRNFITKGKLIQFFINSRKKLLQLKQYSYFGEYLIRLHICFIF